MAEIDQMEAGPEIDALIAEYTMEWVWIQFVPAHDKAARLVRRLFHPDTWSASHGKPASGDEPLALGWNLEVSPFSTDIATAWKVLDKLNTRWFISLSQMAGGVWECWLQEKRELHTGTITLTGCADTPSLAICRAALRQVAIDGNISPRKETE